MDWEDLFVIGAVGISYLIGDSTGKNRAYEQIRQENKDLELQRLRQELEEMKKHFKNQQP
jgi:hypothetical protein